jgi:hypothetical protein
LDGVRENVCTKVTEPDFPWIYSYQEEKRSPASFIIQPLMRPIVILRFCGEWMAENNVAALVDSGCDHVLAARWIAQEIGVTPDPNRELPLQLGGGTKIARFADVTINLLPPDIELQEGGYDPARVRSFQTPVGFLSDWPSPPWSVVLGQNGFFDQFTVSMSRYSQAIAVSDVSDFDGRYPQGPRVSA